MAPTTASRLPRPFGWMFTPSAAPESSDDACGCLPGVGFLARTADHFAARITRVELRGTPSDPADLAFWHCSCLEAEGRAGPHRAKPTPVVSVTASTSPATPTRRLGAYDPTIVRARSRRGGPQAGTPGSSRGSGCRPRRSRCGQVGIRFALFFRTRGLPSGPASSCSASQTEVNHDCR
jgi:hypothetical protein